MIFPLVTRYTEDEEPVPSLSPGDGNDDPRVRRITPLMLARSAMTPAQLRSELAYDGEPRFDSVTPTLPEEYYRLYPQRAYRRRRVGF
jgi:hypothetical protein